MLTYLIIATAIMGADKARFTNDDVRIDVQIKSSLYCYSITNLGESPIVKFTIKEHAAYDPKAPAGWQTKMTSEDFSAWTDDPQTAITKNKTGEFSVRVGSKGAALGKADAQIKLSSGETIIIPQVWSPAPESKTNIIAVTLALFTIVLFHSLIIVRKKHRDKTTAKAS